MSLDLYIVGRSRAANVLSGSDRGRIRSVVSIGVEQGHLQHPNRGCPYGYSSIECPKLRLEFEDTEKADPGSYGPTKAHIQLLLDFGSRINLDGEGILLVHCYVGVSRSTAAAYIIYASKWGTDRAREAAEHVYRSQARHQRYGFADPNRRMVTLASEIVGWDMLTPLGEFYNEFYFTDKWSSFKEDHGGVSQKGRVR